MSGPVYCGNCRHWKSLSMFGGHPAGDHGCGLTGTKDYRGVMKYTRGSDDKKNEKMDCKDYLKKWWRKT